MSSQEDRIASEAEAYFRNQARQAGWVNDPVGWAKDVLGVHLWSKQQEICQSLIQNKRTVVASCHGTGKALGLDELVHTPSGPVRMGDISPGMKVLGSDGSTVEVIATTGEHKADSYRVRLERGGACEEIIASGDHVWPVLDLQSQADIQLRSDRAGVPVETGLWMHKAKMLSTRQIAAMRRGSAVVPGRMPEILLRGSTWEPDEEVLQQIRERGCLDPSGRTSLLWRTRNGEPEGLAEIRAKLTGAGVRTILHRRKDHGITSHHLALMGSHAPTLLPDANQRALALSHLLLTQGSWGDDGWRITAVTPVGERDVQCIQVDSPDHLYLCGERGIPTHNSMIASVLACWWVSTKPPGQAIVVSTAPTYAQVNKILWEEIRKHHSNASRGQYPMPGRVTQADEWKLGDGQIVGFGRKPAKGDRHSFHGIHRRYVLALLDEACHDDQTEVMTDDGWKLFADLTGDEELLTMDQQTHEATYRKPQKIVKKPYTGPMYLYEAKGANFCVTPDHDMYFHGRAHNQDTFWRKAPMEELVGKTDKYMKKTISWTAPDREKFELPEVRSERKFFPARFVEMDDWMTFLGWYLSEGHLIKSHGKRADGIGISQDAPEAQQRIFDLLVRLGFSPKRTERQVHVYNTQLARHLGQFGKNCLEKRVPAYARMASARQIGLLLDSYLEGDGYEKQGQGIIYTSSPQMANDLQEMILKTGKPSVVRKRDLAGRESDFGSHVATSSVDGYVITRPHEDSKIKFYPQNLKKIDYDGLVYCASVPPEAMLLTRRKGYTLWSGNCGVPEEIWTGVEAITTNIGCRILAIGNPDDRNTDFGKNFTEPKTSHLWHRISIPASSTPNFTGEPVPRLLNEVLVSRDWVAERKDDWGEKDPRYISKVLAEFPEQSMSSLFSPSLVADAVDEPPTPSLYSILRLGVDVARFGSDKTVVASYSGVTAQIEESWSGTDTVSSAHKVLQIAERLKDERKAPWVEIRVDAVGLGAGVVDTLNARATLLPEPWFTVYEMHGSATPPADVGGSVYGFYNARAYWFEQLRQKMRNGSVKLVDEDELISDDLKMVFYSIKNGRLLIASKEDMRKEYGKSPDFADAIVYAVAPVAEGLRQGDVLSESAETLADSLVEEDEYIREESIAPY